MTVFNLKNNNPILVCDCSSNLITRCSKYQLLNYCNGISNFDFYIYSLAKPKYIVMNIS